MSDNKPTPRKRRRDRGPRLTERDLLLLRWTGEQYALRFDQARRILGAHPKAATLEPGLLSESATRHTIDRWEQAGLVVCRKILADEPASLWLTPAGLHAAGLPFRRFEPSPSSLRHLYWCNQIRWWLAQKQPGAHWRSERWLRWELDQKIKSVKLPDAQVSVPGSGLVALEVELTQKNTVKLAEILRDRSMVYPQVWYFAPAAVCRALQQARQELDAVYQQRVFLSDLKEVL